MTGPRTFSVTTAEEALVVMPLHSIGSLDEETLRPELDTLLAQLEAHRRRHVVIDLTKVSYFGTALLKALHAIWRHARKLNGAMALCNVSEFGREVLHVSKFDTLWPVCGSRSEALQQVVTSGNQSEGPP